MKRIITITVALLVLSNVLAQNIIDSTKAVITSPIKIMWSLFIKSSWPMVHVACSKH